MTTPEIRAGLYREWLLAVRVARWELLQRRYRKARRSRVGQRRAWLELREHACLMMAEGL
jgi:hypothetical protein